MSAQARVSRAKVVIGHHARLAAKPGKGNAPSSVLVAQRMRSEHLALKRCLTSRSGSWPIPVLVAKAVRR